MQFTLKDYKGHKYLEYFDEKSDKTFTNSEYFIFDTICEDFKAIMKDTGGFVANMTIRLIKELNLPCESIMLCQTPHNNNTFQFQFVYLGENREVLNIEWDNNYFDYEYFKKKFSDCIIEQGCIFDLLKYDYLKEVTKEFKTPSISFDLNIDGKDITSEDTLICKDLCFLKEDYKEKFQKYGVSYAELTYKFDCFNPNHFIVRFIKEDGTYLPNYQASLDCKDIEEFREKFGSIDEDYYTEPFDDSVSVSIIRYLSEHFELKNKEKEGEIEYEH